MLPTPDSAICVDGFPRSANSYAYYLVQYSQPEGFGLSGHTHSSEALINAVRMGVPSVLVAREPRATVASLVQHVGSRITISDAVHAYLRFYRRLAQVRESLIVSDFPRTTSDGGWFLREVNRRHGTNFEPYVATPEHEERVFELLDHSALTYALNVPTEQVTPRPSRQRKSAAQILSGVTPREERLLDIAAAVHHTFVSN